MVNTILKKIMWVEYDWNNPATHPPEYGRYLIYRKGCDKMQFEVWNGSGWASSNRDCSHWSLFDPPIKGYKKDFTLQVDFRDVKDYELLTLPEVIGINPRIDNNSISELERSKSKVEAVNQWTIKWNKVTDKWEVIYGDEVYECFKDRIKAIIWAANN